MLSRHIDPDEIIETCKEHPHRKHASRDGRQGHVQSWRRDEDASAAAYQLLHDETALDGNPLLNLASFQEADKLIMENMNKNLVGDLWHAPKEGKVIGTATAGSSEAIMLGGLAMKKRWQEGRKAAGKDYFHPNIVFGSNAQVALEKFARYFDVETRLVPVKESNGFVMDPNDAIQYVDENTIGIIVIFGSTYTGHFEDVALMSKLLDDLQQRTGLDIPIHVDGASGAFIAPFAYPQLKWDFKVPRVVSINTSGHKFGLTYAGLGWVLWRDESYLHKDLVFELHYLGSVEYTFTLNFSKPAAPVIAQMFNFLNLGFDGYRKIAWKDLRNARMLSKALESTYFTVLSHPSNNAKGKNQHENNDDPEHYMAGVPVVAFRLNDKYKEENPSVQQQWIATMLRTKGWIIPNYNAPQGAEDVEILRVVVRETLSEDLMERLIIDILGVTEALAGPNHAFSGDAGQPKGITHPDHDHARPVKDNFDGLGEALEQLGFSSQC
ncbi:glutamate decarboxylase [Coprinellus micaceus]|uniref:Glutamate decarboxylase n=1 Tax=Coprinellus micaceus TaxID=71717 RepID=A0A4Y7TCE6_COPMI|nr:glutamate decarboxylase [Coprinellus micaceus]